MTDKSEFEAIRAVAYAVDAYANSVDDVRALLAHVDALEARLARAIMAATFPLSGAYAPSATCKHREHPFNCPYCDPRLVYFEA